MANCSGKKFCYYQKVALCVLHGHSAGEATIRKWFNKFCRGHMNTENMKKLFGYGWRYVKLTIDPKQQWTDDCYLFLELFNCNNRAAVIDKGAADKIPKSSMKHNPNLIVEYWKLNGNGGNDFQNL